MLVTVYNLSNNTDVEETKAKVEAYKKENLAIISKNRLRQVGCRVLHKGSLLSGMLA